MGIVNVIATASVAVANIVQPIGPVGIINTNTETKQEVSKEFAQEAQAPEEIKEENPIKTPEEQKNNDILARWKEKQTALWDGLSKEKFTINASAYTSAADECGKSDGITSSGIKVQANRTLACPPQYPFGVIIEIEGMGRFRCEDRGGAIKGNHFDIYMETKAEAFEFGRQNRTAWIVG